MTHTVIGLFDNRTEAQAASKELIQQGFGQESIDVSNRATTEATTTSSTDTGNSVSNFFNSLFGDDETTARNYTEAASDADAILTVHADSTERARLAAEILDRNGAIDVDGRSSQTTRQNLSQSTDATQNTANVQNETAIPVIEEELQVGKREVERGGARIKSRVVEKPVEASVRLREEHIVVNRRPVNRAVSDADLANFKEGDIELTERAEEAVVGKQARVVEEVTVGKNVTEREQTVRDTVKRTDVEVEQIDTDNATKTANNRT
ncbi:MAG: YsnF/AvaK domain-containing protein [Acidobacteriota bacterium]|nr:YsnF/AvaK domain-containing protein [Acidobacteriota bacterium]